jgi:hypothetical protein
MILVYLGNRLGMLKRNWEFDVGENKINRFWKIYRTRLCKTVPRRAVFGMLAVRRAMRESDAAGLT